MSCKVVSDVRARQTPGGLTKTEFFVETDGQQVPIRFQCIALGRPGERCAALANGVDCLLQGRLTASKDRDTRVRMSFIVSDVQGVTIPREVAA